MVPDLVVEELSVGWRVDEAVIYLRRHMQVSVDLP